MRTGYRKWVAAITLLAVVAALVAFLSPGYQNSGFPVSPEIIRLEKISPHSRGNLPDPSVLQRTFYPDRLNLPTMLTRIDDLWFIVDSYNNRVLYSDQLDRHIRDWSVLDHKLSRPHSIASDGNLLVVDDTDANAIRVYRRVHTDSGAAPGKPFHLVQIVENAGIRPHRALFDSETGKFYVLAANSQEMLVFNPESAGLRLESRVALSSIQGMYTRSFRLMGEDMWLLTGYGLISVVSYRDHSFREKRRISVPPDYRGLNDLWFQHGSYYLTATLGKFGRCELVQDTLHCVDARGEIPGRGNPYLFSEVIPCNEGSIIFLGLVGGKDTIVSLQFNSDGSIRESGMLFERGNPVPGGKTPNCGLRLAGRQGPQT